MVLVIIVPAHDVLINWLMVKIYSLLSEIIIHRNDCPLWMSCFLSLFLVGQKSTSFWLISFRLQWEDAMFFIDSNDMKFGLYLSLSLLAHILTWSYTTINGILCFWFAKEPVWSLEKIWLVKKLEKQMLENG